MEWQRFIWSNMLAISSFCSYIKAGNLLVPLEPCCSVTGHISPCTSAILLKGRREEIIVEIPFLFVLFPKNATCLWPFSYHPLPISFIHPLATNKQIEICSQNCKDEQRTEVRNLSKPLKMKTKERSIWKQIRHEVVKRIYKTCNRSAIRDKEKLS